MEIITNNRARPLQSFYDLPTKVQADFGERYVLLADHYSPRFVQYRGHWYDVYDTMALEQSRLPLGALFSLAAGGWHSYISDSYFSGVLFRLGCDDTVVVGRYFS